MKKYKGYVIESGSSEHEEKEWSGGHSSEGTGRYYTSYWTKTFNLKTKNTEYFSSEEEAINAIDNRRANKKHNNRVALEQKRLESRKKKIEAKIKDLERSVWPLDKKISDLYSEKRKIP